MNKVVEEIREALKPHHVEGFTAMCFPMPTLRQVEQLTKEVERLTTLVDQKEATILALSLKAESWEAATHNARREKSLEAYRVFLLRLDLYQTGADLAGNVWDEEDIERVGKEMIGRSGICRSCGGTGEDGDPEGGTYSCEVCKGTGLTESANLLGIESV